jgi:hypothetical protein
MAKRGFKVMDSDMHIFEPVDLWQRYIDPKFADRAPVGLNRSFRDLGIKVEGKVLPIPRNPENPALAKYRHNFFSEKYGDAGKRNFDSVSQIQAMNKEGLDVAVLFPTRGLCVLGSMDLIRSWPLPSLEPTTTGCMTLRRLRRIACTASPWSRRMMSAQP